MLNQNYFIPGVLLVVLLFSVSFSEGQTDNIAPEVAMTAPLNGSTDVDPATTKIVVTFNEPMQDRSWSWSYENRDTFPYGHSRLSGVWIPDKPE
jgi:hypothetical protein